MTVPGGQEQDVVLSAEDLREWLEAEHDPLLTNNQAWALVRSHELLRAEAGSLRKALERTLFIADHLYAMVPQDVWRATGGDDMQGHYEGDYHAAQVGQELAEIRAAVAGAGRQ